MAMQRGIAVVLNLVTLLALYGFTFESSPPFVSLLLAFAGAEVIHHVCNGTSLGVRCYKACLHCLCATYLYVLYREPDAITLMCLGWFLCLHLCRAKYTIK
ncbi:hypothetical protein [Pseudoalteromonas sp. OOF1S-7]|uniref:hypothetical protein n=1 Tax=Pseudoalteromonas sp. OOF1S-7 TaxID=2917757 RepID=UPI001EF745F7|nr:hypothetical protein [Pseudoalteromonas sp. OOF1S-7]MCG7535561.1 hypothetical protein [Pseudoalteromonas sp. OOF1S-7]